ncbi:MAG: hypothetical protein K0R65_1852 [Crocinitomicaceae bacterium]|jgi:hypothetical protein|nr:hypothetical protein [Crocinitomicaceae bacterium]
MEEQFSGNNQRKKYCFSKKSPYREMKIKKHIARIFFCDPLNDRDRETFFSYDTDAGFAR